jgi:hypothetical protein
MMCNVRRKLLLSGLVVIVGAAWVAGAGWRAWLAAGIGAALLFFMAHCYVPPRRIEADKLQRKRRAEPISQLFLF